MRVPVVDPHSSSNFTRKMAPTARVFEPITESVGESVNVRPVRRGIRVAKLPHYQALQVTQSCSMNITAWLTWFLNCLVVAMSQR